MKASWTFTLLLNPQIHTHSALSGNPNYRELLVCVCFFYLCLRVCFSVLECVFVCSRVNSVWFVLWLCSLQIYFLSMSQTVCVCVCVCVCVFRVSCQVIILSDSETWTDMNKRERIEWQTLSLSLSLWSNHGNRPVSVTTAAGWKPTASVLFLYLLNCDFW